MVELSPSLQSALKALGTNLNPRPMREIARGQGCTSQAMACRVFRLRELGLAVKTGPEAYAITEAGIQKALELGLGDTDVPTAPGNDS